MKAMNTSTNTNQTERFTLIGFLRHCLAGAVLAAGLIATGYSLRCDGPRRRRPTTAGPRGHCTGTDRSVGPDDRQLHRPLAR